MSDDFNPTVAEVMSLGDVVILLRKSGQSGVAYIRGHKAPYDVSIDYGGGKDDPPLSIRRVTIKVGWTAKAWRDADPETREAIGRGAELWREMHHADEAESEAA